MVDRYWREIEDVENDIEKCYANIKYFIKT